MMDVAAHFPVEDAMDAIREAQRQANMSGGKWVVQVNHVLHRWDVVSVLRADPDAVVEICSPVRGAA